MAYVLIILFFGGFGLLYFCWMRKIYLDIRGIPELYKSIKRRPLALPEAYKEIERQKRNLQIAQLQMVTKDRYGNPHYKKWEKEIQHFMDTRIVPILRYHGIGDFSMDKYREKVRARIWEVAHEAIKDAGSSSTDYVSNPAFFNSRMNPFDYEQHCALILKNGGWDAYTTPKSGDQGADVIARKGSVTIVIQCKLYSGKIGNSAVQQAYAAKAFHHAQAALVVSNAMFTPAAKQAAAMTGVHLVHHRELLDTAAKIYSTQAYKRASS